MQTGDPAVSTGPRMTFAQQVRSFPKPFWVANVIELIERFSFYGVRMIAAVYITSTPAEGGLDFSSTDKGLFFGIWALIQCLLPMFTGGFSDRYGYRRSLMVAFGINIVGYALMGYTTSWWGFMGACCLIGTGTAIFKPPLHGTLAHCVNDANSSVGWGIFYQVVNIGAFIGPVVCGYLRLLQWKYAFFAASAIILLNVTVTGLFLKDYAKGTTEKKGPVAVFCDAIITLCDLRFVVFLAICSAFYFMFMQVTDQMTIFIAQWVDTNDVARTFADWTGMKFFADMAAHGGQFNPEWIVNVDAGSIILLVVLVSYFMGKIPPILAMTIGMFVACVGFIWAGMMTTGWSCVLGIFVFALGEMACGPKLSEYVGLIAPPEKKALYMGYSNIPFAFGWTGANLIGGPVYDLLSNKYLLARDYLVKQLGQAPDSVAKLTNDEVIPRLTELVGGTSNGARQLLWTHYHPQNFWYICFAVGMVATLAMVGYHFWLRSGVKQQTASG